MQIYVSDSSTDLVDAISELIELHCEIILFNNLKNIDFETQSYVFFDLDTDKKFYTKSLKFFKKNKLDLKTVLIADSMTPKDIKKHQKSKEAANFYLKFPLNAEVLSAVLGLENTIESTEDDYLEQEPDLSTDSTLQEIVIDRELEVSTPVKSELSDNAKKISSKLDELFDMSSIDLPSIKDESEDESDNTAQVTGILEEIILDDVIEEFEDITLLDPTPEEDHTIKIQYESDQLFPEDDDLEYPDLDNSHEKELLKEIGSELDTSEDIDELRMPSLKDQVQLQSIEPAPEVDTLEGLEFDDDEVLDSTDNLDLIEESLDMSNDELNLDELNSDLDLTIEESSELNDLDELSNNLDLTNELDDNSISLELGIEDESNEINLSGEELNLDLENNLSIDELSLDDSSESQSLDVDLSFNSDDLDLNIESSELDLSLDSNDSSDLELSIDESDIDEGSSIDELSLDFDSSDDAKLENDELVSIESDDEVAPLQFDTLDSALSTEETSSNINLNDESSSNLTEPDLGFSKKTIADHQINQMDNSLHFNVEKEDTAISVTSNKQPNTKKAKPEVDNHQSQLDEIDSMMNQDNLESPETPQSDYSSSQSEEYTDEQLIKLTETIKFLRMDRDQLESKLHEIEDGKLDERRNVELYKSQLEEKGIEIGIMSKRYTKQIEKLQRNLEEANKHKEILLEKNKLISSKIDQNITKKEYDLSRIRKREIELENKLEMLKTDTQVQLKTREDKIIELKRRIDTLEFDMNTIQNQESKAVVKRTHLENKLDKVIDTLRDAIEDLETSDVSLENIEELSKRLKDSI